MNKKGVDLNQYRYIPDYTQFPKDGYEFAIIKLATGTTFVNPLFATQYRGCKDAGMYVGVYTRAADVAGDGAEEAKYALNILDGQAVDFPIYYDIEGKTLNASKSKLTQMALDFGKVITAAGYRWGVYSSRSHFKMFDMDALKKAGASIWCAAYDSSAGMDCDIWQRSDSGKLTGYTGPVDVDILYNESIIHRDGGIKLNLISCYQSQGAWYNQTSEGVPVGICWHDTGAGNPELRRYVQPSTDDPEYDYFITLFGKNQYGNHWNRMEASGAGLNAWIGKLADGTIATVQAGPWNKMPWGVGGGRYGSLNGKKGVDGDKFWIQFEICDDYAHGQSCNKDYFEQAYQQAVAFTAYICQLYNIDPFGTVPYCGHDIPTICCHQDSYRLGFGGNHGDVYLWFNRFGKTMDDVRRDVGAMIGKVATGGIIAPESSASRPILQNGDHNSYVKTLQERLIAHGYDVGKYGADGWFGNGTLAAVKKFQKDKSLTVDGIVGPNTWAELDNEPAAVAPTPAEPSIDVSGYPLLRAGSRGNYVKELQHKLAALGYDIGSYGVDGVFGSATKRAVLWFQKDHQLSQDGIVGLNTWTKLIEVSNRKSSAEYRVQVNATLLNIRSGAGQDYPITGTIGDRGVYTIVETTGDWGKLKSGTGWINLTYCSKI